MAKRKKRKQAERTSWFTSLAEMTPRIPLDAVLGCVLVAAVVGGTYYAWQRWGRDALAGANRGLVEQQIKVPPQPDWITQSNVVAEVYRSGSLGELTLFDSELSLKVHGAFELHPWVAKVDRVGKNPDGGIMVDLHYRQPLAWVEIPPQYTRNKKKGLIPIDREGVRLPNEDLAGRISELPLPRITIRDPSPWPSVAGLTWRDDRIVGAVSIVSMLAAEWQAMGLFRVRVDSISERSSPDQLLYSLITLDGGTVVWGAAPGLELENEPRAADKLARLREYVQNGLSRNQNIDLRMAAVGARQGPGASGRF